MYKRIQPRARGTAFGILKRLSHIHVIVSDLEAIAEAEANDAAATALQPEPAPN